MSSDPKSDLKLAEMLCTRLCHDLTGPIGAVNNGAEFLADEGFDMQHDAMQLIVSSATEAVHRLQFYRAAYGRLNEQGEASLGQKREIVQDFFAATKITIDWPEDHAGASPVSISQKMGRLILNLLIIQAGSLIRGGTVAMRISESAEGLKRVEVVGHGDVIKLDDDTRRVLLREAILSQLTPKTAQLALTLQLLDEVGATLVCEVADGRFRLAAEQLRQPQAEPAGQVA